ncbi:SPV117 putative virion protein [Swinepox virus]|uniref:IMV membrane protein n=2 Tax=Swinepox virus TaxID=10276 RepID=A0A881SYA8_SWPV|nr:IMV membrane protein [Swinepox virus]AAL69856.1 SPV117 putative virion protein [Swinepox virus]QQG31607.1 IMV membrane protein [Swinepox virus]UED36680.1 IMV membrane protein [Swinepox virus]UED36828.1 IMV membrane protein [Swinepox virus]UUA44307.1 SPV117 [Swinepox virus]
MNIEEDINESNFIHLITKLSNGTEVDSDCAAILSTVKELISQINGKVLAINKKSKKNSRAVDSNHVQRRENNRY